MYNTFRDSIIVDAHLDLLLDVAIEKQAGRRNIIINDYLPEFQKGGFNLIVSSIFVEQKYLPEMALKTALNQINLLYEEISENPDKIMLCKGYNDIIQARKMGMIGIMLSFEGAEPITDDLSLLRIYYELGVRCIGLTWNRKNFAAEGCSYNQTNNACSGGLTEHGFKLIDMAEELGMIIDVSHLNQRGFWDVINYAKKPVIASHSNCKSLLNIDRNLDDSQIKAIASKGGVIGINATNILIAENDVNANIDQLIKHIDHIVNVSGVRYVCLGLDLCNRIIGKSCSEEIASMPRMLFDVINGHGELGKLIQGLSEHGYTKEDIDLIIGKNYLRIVKEVLKH